MQMPPVIDMGTMSRELLHTRATILVESAIVIWHDDATPEVANGASALARELLFRTVGDARCVESLSQVNPLCLDRVQRHAFAGRVESNLADDAGFRHHVDTRFAGLDNVHGGYVGNLLARPIQIMSEGARASSVFPRKGSTAIGRTCRPGM